jgi:hypothetical protein
LQHLKLAAQAQLAGRKVRQFGRLVVAALAQAARMQRHRNHALRQRQIAAPSFACQ